MAPMFGAPNFGFINDESSSDEVGSSETVYPPAHNSMREVTLTEMALYYTAFLLGLFITWCLVYFCLKLMGLGQKTREPQPRRMYVGSRVRPSLGQSAPTIYVSPSNLPPPPKYEALAPPSYEEVIGIHYPNYQPPVIGQPIAVQPITQPILTAVAQSSSSSDNNTTTTVATPATGVGPTTVVISSETRRTSVTVASQ